MEGLKLLSSAYLEEYSTRADMDWEKLSGRLSAKVSFSKEDFEFYVQSSAAFSSNIEGNSIDLDTYLKNKKFKVRSKPKEMAEIDDLVKAYQFAMGQSLNEKHFLEAHGLLSRHILSLKSQRGNLRKQQVGIYSEGKLEYMAIEPEYLAKEFTKLFEDIGRLIEETLSMKEIFYYASMMHLLFEKIHPFMDGNGRAGRLLEKWFLATKLGEKAWSLQTEKYYMQHRPAYYQNIHIGLNYYALKMEKSIPFLLMLPDFLQKEISQ